SSVKVCLVPVCLVSTIGLSPVTVTVSATADTPSCVLTLALKPTVTAMPALITVLKPGSSNFTVYVPTLRRGNWNDPVSLGVAVCGCSSEGPVSVTITPGSTAPDVSVTLPKISPVCDWAHAGATPSASASAAS